MKSCCPAGPCFLLWLLCCGSVATHDSRLAESRCSSPPWFTNHQVQSDCPPSFPSLDRTPGPGSDRPSKWAAATGGMLKLTRDCSTSRRGGGGAEGRRGQWKGPAFCEGPTTQTRGVSKQLGPSSSHHLITYTHGIGIPSQTAACPSRCTSYMHRQMHRTSCDDTS
ncbi:hypothetical protein F5882DRAFT_111560 [Hyaloscypha sp. PMI_1271]|nr:hypothetical protein F5882DRAFT_111560 [Hyaloscypha sp. PMI_1271]